MFQQTSKNICLHFVWLLVAITVVIFGSSPSNAQTVTAAADKIQAVTLDAGTLAEQLPKNYGGTFRYDGFFQSLFNSHVYDVAFSFTSMTVLDPGRLEVFGTGHYEGYRDIKIKMLVQVPSLDVEIWETAPAGMSDFTTEGSHKGSLSPDLHKINAKWLPLNSKKYTATLQLEAK